VNVRVPTDQPMGDVARACADAIAAGDTVEIEVPAWRRPGLSKALTAELDARGMVGATWRFLAVDGTDDALDVEGILGWGAPAGATATAAAPVASVPTQHPSGRPLAPSASPASNPRSGDESAAAMMVAAYAVFAQGQPVMTSGLRRRSSSAAPQLAGAPGLPSAAADMAALAELADLDF
jgi:hypothetical protein